MQLDSNIVAFIDASLRLLSFLPHQEIRRAIANVATSVISMHGAVMADSEADKKQTLAWFVFTFNAELAIFVWSVMQCCEQLIRFRGARHRCRSNN